MPHLAAITGAGPGWLAPEAVDLAQRVRQLRAARGWTLDQAAESAGISRSAISKIERGAMSPTFQAMQKLARGFGLSLAEFLATPTGPPTGRRSVLRADQGPRIGTPTYGIRLLTGDLLHTAFSAAEIVVRARSLDEYGDWDRHDDEDLIFVVAGRLVLYTEQFAPVSLNVGDSVYFDARIGHACITTGAGEARALWVTAPIR
jgi:transcriptional regulator with XRE-family HTH domain